MRGATAVVSVSADALRAERARVMEARAPREALERQRHRARQVLTGRWDASEEELRGEIAAQYEQLSAHEVEELLVVALAVQRSERPKVDPATVNVRYQEDPEAGGKRKPAKRPAPAAKSAPAPPAHLAENGRKKRRPLARPTTTDNQEEEESPVISYEGRNPGHRKRVWAIARSLLPAVTPAELVEAVGSAANLTMTLKQAEAILRSLPGLEAVREARQERAAAASPAVATASEMASPPISSASPPPPVSPAPAEPAPAVAPPLSRPPVPAVGLAVPPAPYPRAVTRGVAGGGIAVLPQLGTSRVRLWVDMEMPAYEARNVVDVVMGIMEDAADD
ncbi:MAG: hypothetical protein M0R75_01655 [Dehalococcoidia bacterium]|nr:hypothetical protein [Dehalococcoidia bacterium]